MGLSMKTLVLLLIFTSLVKHLSIKILFEGCDKESSYRDDVTTHCENYLFGFLDSARLSLLSNNNDFSLP